MSNFMRCRKLLPFLVVAIVCSLNTMAQKLPRSEPEAQGVSSKDIMAFLDAANKSKNEFHSFMILRHGKVVAEGWWNPYKPELKHTLYSCSKTFTATAVGFAVQEKLLSLNDKVTTFFKDELPDTVSANLADLTVKDVLIMSDGQEPDPTFKIGVDSNWVHAFLATPVVHDPGTTFLYNSLGTYMLSAIVQKVTGQKIVDYLKPRLFDPLGITGMDWEEDTKGINTGGWGLRVKTEDIARFGQMFLQKGMWNGKQILPASWIEEATTAQIMQKPDATAEEKAANDWIQGYCYQMWRCRNNAVRGDGAYGQYMIIMPEQDAVIAITAETPDMQDEINLVWKYLLPAMQKDALPADNAASKMLKEKIASLALAPPAKKDAAMATSISGKQYVFAANDKHMQNISFNYKKDMYHVTLSTDTAKYEFDFAAGKWQPGTTTKPGPSLTGAGFENRVMLYPAKTVASYTWTDDNSLQLKLRYIESPHTETFTCHFDGNKLTMDVERSFDYGKNTVTLTAESK